MREAVVHVKKLWKPRMKMSYKILPDPKNFDRSLSEVIEFLGIEYQREIVGCQKVSEYLDFY